MLKLRVGVGGVDGVGVCVCVEGGGGGGALLQSPQEILTDMLTPSTTARTHIYIYY